MIFADRNTLAETRKCICLKSDFEMKDGSYYHYKYLSTGNKYDYYKDQEFYIVIGDYDALTYMDKKEFDNNFIDYKLREDKLKRILK